MLNLGLFSGWPSGRAYQQTGGHCSIYSALVYLLKKDIQVVINLKQQEGQNFVI